MPSKHPVALDTTINDIINTELAFLLKELDRGRVPKHKVMGWSRVAKMLHERVGKLLETNALDQDVRARLADGRDELNFAIDEVNRHPRRHLVAAQAALNEAAQLVEKCDLAKQSAPAPKTKKAPTARRARSKKNLRVGDLELEKVKVYCPDKSYFQLEWDPIYKTLYIEASAGPGFPRTDIVIAPKSAQTVALRAKYR
jgi:hypothetical protein